jgi:hypothetical protein
MEPILIQIDWIYFLGIIAALIGVAWYSGSRFSALDTSVSWIKDSITKLEGRMDNAFASGSPVKLLSKGVEILNESGMKDYIESRKKDLVEKCEFNKKGLTNQYDIQEKSFECFDKLDFGSFNEKLKETSFKYGMSIETIRRIGGIYFRDILLSENGFTPEDLDKPKTGQ